jgi:hypothetical protein
MIQLQFAQFEKNSYLENLNLVQSYTLEVVPSDF